MLKCAIKNSDALFSELSEKANLYIPEDTDKGAAFKLWEEGMSLSKSLNTARSPKDFFFPQSQDLMAFKMSGKEIEIEDIRSESEDFILFGVRACDAVALEVLDKVFLEDTEDSYYLTRRNHGVIITLACNRPAETCFCSAFGIDAKNPKGDISVWQDDEYYYFLANTEKGKKLLSDISVLEECDDNSANGVKELINERLSKLPLSNLSAEKFGTGKTMEFFDREEWAELSESCLGCGTCTFVCPTCQCYDIKDFNTGKGVVRYRCWDSCMYSEFTKMSAGQPRLTQKERFRQRFMHKLMYFPERYGMFSCVGCGRCLAKCPISMNIVKVMKRLGGDA